MMFDGIEALVALAERETVSEAAVQLGLTQSAVSKRLRSLETKLGFALIEPHGRRVALTAAARAFVDQARPLVAELRNLASPARGQPTTHLELGMSGSIASTWGPAVLRHGLEVARSVDVSVSTDRSMALIEAVRLGRIQAALCTGHSRARDLVSDRLIDEPMILLHARQGQLPAGATLVTVDKSTAAWRSMLPALQSGHADLLRQKLVAVQTFGAAAQMAKAGFGDALIPLGMALEMRCPPSTYTPLRGVSRPVTMVARKRISNLPAYRALVEGVACAVNVVFMRSGSALGRS